MIIAAGVRVFYSAATLLRLSVGWGSRRSPRPKRTSIAAYRLTSRLIPAPGPRPGPLPRTSPVETSLTQSEPLPL
jgi:hypothetical protein